MAGSDSAGLILEAADVDDILDIPLEILACLASSESGAPAQAIPAASNVVQLLFTWDQQLASVGCLWALCSAGAD